MEIRFRSEVRGVKGITPGMYEAHYVGFEDIEERIYGTEEMEEKIALLFEIKLDGHPKLPLKVRPFISKGKKPTALYSFLEQVVENPSKLTSTQAVYAAFNALFGRAFLVSVGVTQSGWNKVISVNLAPNQKKISDEELQAEMDRADDIPEFLTPDEELEEMYDDGSNM